MDVKFIVTDRAHLNEISIINGQLIYLSDENATFYDMSNSRLPIASIRRVGGLPATGYEGIIYVNTNDSPNRAYVWNGATSAYIPITYPVSYSPTLTSGVEIGKITINGVSTKLYSPTVTGVTGVKGDSESTYRTGNVNLTKANIGLGNVGNFKAVSTVANQGLTSSEKANARTNIGATNFSGKYADLTGKPGVVSMTADGLAPVVTSTSAFLRGDGTWATPAGTGVRSVATGTSNGTINVNTNGSTANVAVKGLGTAAYTASTAYSASGHTHTLTLAADSGTSSLAMAANTKYKITAGGSSFIFTTPPDTGSTYSVVSTAANGLAPKITNTSGYLKGDGTWSNPPGTVYDVVSTSANGLAPKVTDTSKFLKGDGTWATPTNTTYTGANGISLSGTTFSNSGVRSIATGTSNGTINVNTNGSTANVAVKGLGTAAYTASTAYAASGHTHTLSIAADSGTSALTMSANTKYKLTAGGNTFIFTTPPDADSVTGVKGNSETSYRTGNVNITKANIGLGNVVNPATVSGTLAAGSTSIELSNASITTASNISIFASDPMLNYTGATVAAGKITITFAAQSAAKTIKVYAF